ncbi:hypothetical protein EDD75_1254 [Thermodesulfitimonas autotrophica]|uniref:Uncharacterized protein n=1 Tax=Thermodesulfitimonas autotrophica TaxID=1894989 RepID=A0A3N5AQ52_9THEO|nr:hypothetical protein EDD75_1254 [Thermodesulfitimonas autotrophica]
MYLYVFILVFSFQPTYEELKQGELFDLINELDGFQPTYEELKHTYYQIQDYRCQGFQPTYEELKQEVYVQREGQHQVSSLPTRN